MPAPSTDDLLALIGQYVSLRFPGERALDVRINFESTRYFSSPIPLQSKPAATGDSDDEPLYTGLREDILDALGNAESPIKATTLASKIGRKYSGSFRAIIREMKELGQIIVDDHGRYSLPPE